MDGSMTAYTQRENNININVEIDLSTFFTLSENFSKTSQSEGLILINGFNQSV